MNRLRFRTLGVVWPFIVSACGGRTSENSVDSDEPPSSTGGSFASDAEECESYTFDTCPTDDECLAVVARSVEVRGVRMCFDGTLIKQCRRVGDGCTDADAQKYYCDGAGNHFVTTQLCGPLGTVSCSPETELNTEPCLESIQPTVGGLYANYCEAAEEDDFCSERQLALQGSIERALNEDSLPPDVILIGVEADVVLPDGKALGRWSLTFSSPESGATYDVEVVDGRVLGEYVKVSLSDVVLNCSPDDAVEWEGIPAMVSQATQQALAELDWEIQPNEFYSSFRRYSACDWRADWGLSYLSFQTHPPDSPGHLAWVYVEYTLDGKLAQLCRIDKDDCTNAWGWRDP